MAIALCVDQHAVAVEQQRLAPQTHTPSRMHSSCTLRDVQVFRASQVTCVGDDRLTSGQSKLRRLHTVVAGCARLGASRAADCI